MQYTLRRMVVQEEAIEIQDPRVDLMVIVEVAEESGLDRSTVGKLLDLGVLPTVIDLDAPSRQGRRLIRRVDFNAWMDARRSAGKDAQIPT